jgi:hypothetical protein
VGEEEEAMEKRLKEEAEEEREEAGLRTVAKNGREFQLDLKLKLKLGLVRRGLMETDEDAEMSTTNPIGH